jgi:hypothetical protein
MATPRAEAIKFAEQVRSTIVAYIRAAGEPVTIRGLAGAPAICVHWSGSTPDLQTIDRHVRMLWGSGILRRIRVNRPKEPNSQYGYEYVDEAERTKRVATKPVAVDPTSPMDVMVVATKSGTLRIAFRGLTIEIGVEK